jgi:hypothetical protein
MKNEYWMIGYSQESNGKIWPVRNLAINKHPINWVLEKNTELPNCITVVHFAVKISAEQFNTADGEL